MHNRIQRALGEHNDKLESEIDRLSSDAPDATASMGLVERIKMAMARQRMSLKTLSERSGLPYRTAQSWLLGERRIPASALVPLAEALGCSTDWLLVGKGAVFDEDLLVDYLDIIEQIRHMSNHTAPFTECARLFDRLYNDEYMKARRASRQDVSLLEGAIAELRRLRSGH